MGEKVSIPTLKRLPYYYNIVCKALDAGDKYISSAAIAKSLDVDDTQVRKDISAIGYVGKPKVGFDVAEFKKHLENFLEYHKTRNAILVGAGNLGIALSKYDGFEQYGLKLIAIFDNDPMKIGLKIADKEVFPLDKMQELIKKSSSEIAILAVPAPFAQGVADRLVKSGVKAIWNFAPTSLTVPDDVFVQTQDLAASFTIFTQLALRKGVI